MRAWHKIALLIGLWAAFWFFGVWSLAIGLILCNVHGYFCHDVGLVWGERRYYGMLWIGDAMTT